jgi:ferric enterobactin receptor
MKFIYVLFSFFIFVSISRAQTAPKPGGYKIYGQIIDAVTHQALENVSVNLIEKSSQQIKSIKPDQKGYFSFSQVAPGNYSVQVSYIGYEGYTNPNVVVNDHTGDVSLGEINLKDEQKVLNEVFISGSKPIVENRIDKLVYNADQDITSQGGVATDILKKIPEVTVDALGNVELRGNPSIRFLIDGNPSGIFGNSIADALQSIPASQIKSIEVITSPGAKYDATGTGGIINIILKKSKVQGVSGNVNLTAGTRLENGSMNLAWKHNNMSFNSYFGGTDQLKANTINSISRVADDPQGGTQNILNQNGNSDLTRHGARAGIGFDWDLSNKDYIGAAISYNGFGNESSGLMNQLSTTSGTSGILSQIASLRNASSKFDVHTFEGSINYKKKFKQDKHELAIVYNVSRGQNNSYYNQTQFYTPTGPLFDGSTSNNPGRDNTSVISIDYSLPLSKTFLLETGGRLEEDHILSDAAVFTYSPNSQTFEFDNGQSYTSDYHRKIYAGYVSGSFKAFNYLDIIAGARLEHTDNQANYSNAPGTQLPSYNNFAPALTISHNFPNEQSLKFAYSYRIERPDYRDLNPFVNLSDPHNITTGNPQLNAEIGRNYEFGYSKTFTNGNTLNLTAYYSRNNPDIKSYTQYFPTYKIGDSTYTDVNLTTRVNISSEVKTGISLSGSVLVGNKITIRSSIQVYDRKTVDNYATPAVLQGIEYRMTMNCSYLINKSWVAEAFGNYNSGVKWQGTQPSFTSYTIAVKKQLFNDKASLGLVAVNAINEYLDQQSYVYGQNFTQLTIKRIPYRSFGINLAYKFGKLKFSKSKEAENYLLKPPVEN